MFHNKILFQSPKRKQKRGYLCKENRFMSTGHNCKVYKSDKTLSNSSVCRSERPKRISYECEVSAATVGGLALICSYIVELLNGT